jgi:hypothetical protein
MYLLLTTDRNICTVLKLTICESPDLPNERSVFVSKDRLKTNIVKVISFMPLNYPPS